MPLTRTSRRGLSLAALWGGLTACVSLAQTTNLPPGADTAASPLPDVPWEARLLTTAREEWGCDHRGTLQFSTLGLLLSEQAQSLIPKRWTPAAAIHAAEVRLDLKAAPTSWLDLGLDPRLRLTSSQFAGGDFAGASEVYLGGWRVQVRPTEDTQLAWSRQNLQWGPSYLTSPSNPFGGSNGKNLPSAELPNMTYLKAAWIPADRWSVSALANVVGTRTPRTPTLPSLNLPPLLSRLSAGSRAGDRFEPTCALKNDFTFDRRTFSAVVSQRGADDPRIGAYGSWNVSDAMILYAEGATDAQSDHDLLAGATYTFADGSFVALEYYFNGGAADDGAASGGLLGGTTAATMVSGGFASRNYVLAQYVTSEFITDTTLAARWIINLNQRCHRLALQADYDLGDQTVLFANVVADVGDESDEYGAQLQVIATVGLNLLF